MQKDQVGGKRELEHYLLMCGGSKNQKILARENFRENGEKIA